MANASEAVYFLTYNGPGMAELKGAGLFSTGTSVYVTEEIANLAKASGGSWEIVAPGKAPAAHAAPAAAAAHAAPKHEEKKHEEKKAEAPKPAEKKPEAPKAAEKAAEKPAEEKKAEEAPKAEAAKS